jgi:hypothetical protein
VIEREGGREEQGRIARGLTFSISGIALSLSWRERGEREERERRERGEREERERRERETRTWAASPIPRATARAVRQIF